MVNDSLVSVVIPTYQRATFLERAITSVLAQTYTRWEIIVVDDNDASSAYRRETRSFMERYRDDSRISYLEHPENRGGSAARNTGIRAAQGEYVAFLDDDDEWQPTKLAAQLRCFELSGRATAFVYTGFEKVDTATGERVAVIPSVRGDVYESLLKRNPIGTTSTVMCRKDALLEVGLFDETLPAKQDIDLYIRLAQAYRVDFVSDVLATFYNHAQERISTSSDAAVRSHEIFYEKYKDRLGAYPEIHSYRLIWDGRIYLTAGLEQKARHRFKKALSVKALNPEALLWLGFSYLSDAGRMRVAHLTRYIGRLKRASVEGSRGKTV